MSNNPSNCCHCLRRLVVLYKGEIGLHFDQPSHPAAVPRASLAAPPLHKRRKGLVWRHYPSCSVPQKLWGTWIFISCGYHFTAVCNLLQHNHNHTSTTIVYTCAHTKLHVARSVAMDIAEAVMKASVSVGYDQLKDEQVNIHFVYFHRRERCVCTVVCRTVVMQE